MLAVIGAAATGANNVTNVFLNEGRVSQSLGLLSAPPHDESHIHSRIRRAKRLAYLLQL
jgi:hypothetical protein